MWVDPRVGERDTFCTTLAFEVVMDFDGIRRLPVLEIMALHFLSGFSEMFVILLYASAMR